MERSVALKKLGKILGKSLGYRVDPKAPDHDEREEARAKLKEETAKRKALDERMTARKTAILQADAEYQQLIAEYKEAAQRCDELSSTSRHYRFTVGVTNGMWFMVKAEGDSWEEVIEKVTK